MFGVGRPTIIVVARTLQAARLIRYSRGVITVLDRSGLEAASCECYWKVRNTFERLLPGSFACCRNAYFLIVILAKAGIHLSSLPAFPCSSLELACDLA